MYDEIIECTYIFIYAMFTDNILLFDKLQTDYINFFFLICSWTASSRIEGGVFEQLNASNAQYMEVKLSLTDFAIAY